MTDEQNQQANIQDPFSAYINTAHYVAVKRLVTEYPGNQISEDEAAAFAELENSVAEIQFSLNISLITEANVLEFYTKYIETDPILEELILNCAGEFRVRHRLIGNEWKNYCKLLAEAVHPAPIKGSLLHQNITSRVGAFTDLAVLLEANPWLTYCITLSFANVVKIPARDIGKTSTKRRTAS